MPCCFSCSCEEAAMVDSRHHPRTTMSTLDTPSRRTRSHVSFPRCACGCARRAAAAVSRLSREWQAQAGSRRTGGGPVDDTAALGFDGSSVPSAGSVLFGSNARTARRPSKERVKHCRSATEHRSFKHCLCLCFFLFPVFRSDVSCNPCVSNY